MDQAPAAVVVLNSSVTAVVAGVLPPKPKAAVFVPAPASVYLAVPKSAVSVQFVPFQVSVAPVVGLPEGVPPKANAAVVVPTPANFALAVFKSFTSVQEDPL